MQNTHLNAQYDFPVEEQPMYPTGEHENEDTG